MGSSVEITPELMAGFLDEAPEYLEMLDAGLMEFESKAGTGVLVLDTPEDQEQMNVMFRAAHSLKGLAAAFGFDNIKELTHRMETLFDHVRMGKRNLSCDSFETLFKVFDCLKSLVQELSDESMSPVNIDDVLASLDAILESSPPPEPAVVEAEGSPDSESETINSGEGTSSNSETEAVVLDSALLDDSELLTLFVETTGEAVDELNQGLLGLEESPQDSELLNTVFRCAHNIKGASGAAGLRGMNRLTHDMETVFDELRNHRLTLSEELMNAVFQVVDRLRATVDRIRGGSFEDVAIGNNENPFSQWLGTGSQPAPTQSKDTSAGSAATGESRNDNQLPIESTFEDETDGKLTVAVTFPKDSSEAAIQAYLIHNRLTDLGTVISSDPDIDAMTGDAVVETIVFTIESEVPAPDIEQAVGLYLVESVIVRPVGGKGNACDKSESDTPSVIEQKNDTPQTETVTAGSQSSSRPPSPATSNAKQSTSAPAGTETPTTPRAPTNREASATATTPPSESKPASRSVGAKKEQGQARAGETLRVDRARLDQLMNLGGELVINRARFTQIHGRFREVFNGKNLGYLVDDMTERLSEVARHIESTAPSGGDDRDAEALTSHLSHLNQSFASVRGLVERVHNLRTAMYDFDEALHGLTRVTDGIQKGIMGTRMAPIGPLFGRFRRVVRDISKSNGKKVELVLRGEHTELDKRMIDELGDPLTHMIRNSVDHGIEMPEDRKSAGKPEAGTVILEASHRGNSICIEVTDDGAGINVERVKEKILERDLLTAAQVDSMTDRDLIQYIFKPGFSTAAVVTDLSGRGMGMDIVVNKIEKLSGTVEIDSTEGQGARVTIKLPLTLAILTSIVIRIGKGVYAIPLETVAEIITVRQDHIQWIQRRPVIRVRDRIIPLAYFEDVFGTSIPGLQTETRSADEVTLIIVGFENDKIGLIVDELLGQEDVVIKSLSENYRNVRGVAGASIRGDGTVSLILDIGAVMKMAAQVGVVEPTNEPILAATEG